MLKRIIYIILITTNLLLVASCEGFLDKTPANGIESNSAVTNLNQAQTALYGVYNSFQTYLYYGATHMYYGSVRGDLFQARMSNNRSSGVYEFNHTIEYTYDFWSIGYTAIKNANNLIYYMELDSFESDDDDTYNNIMAEVKFLRALTHFDLVKLYSLPYTYDKTSMGIPIMSEPILSTSDFSSVNSDRGTVSDTYDFIVSELLSAAELVNETIVYGETNKWAIKTLLSRVYLYMGENAKALAIAEEVIGDNVFSLWSNDEYASEFGNYSGSNTEFIFAITYSLTDSQSYEGIGSLLSQYGYSDAILTPKLVNYFKENPDDIRVNTTLARDEYNSAISSELYGDDKVFTKKFPGTDDVYYLDAHVPVLRYSEVVLNAAEAAQKLGESTKADYYINQIAVRSGKTYSNVTLDEVLWERGVELYGEGQRSFDLLRNNMTVDRSDRYEYTLTVTDSEVYDNSYYRSILPIPSSEIYANSAMASQQNPGY